MNHKISHSKREKYKDQFGGLNNEVYTPKEAIQPLLPFIEGNSYLWDCAYGNGELAKHFRGEGFVVHGSPDHNFLDDSPFARDKYQIIVTNPPYSFKDEFLIRAYQIGKPFAFLLPITTLEGKKRNELFREHGIQLIIPNKRINFDIPSGKKSAWFATAWFCHGLSLPKDLNFVKLDVGTEE